MFTECVICNSCSQKIENPPSATVFRCSKRCSGPIEINELVNVFAVMHFGKHAIRINHSANQVCLIPFKEIETEFKECYPGRQLVAGEVIVQHYHETEDSKEDRETTTLVLCMQKAYLTPSPVGKKSFTFPGQGDPGALV